MFAGWYITFLLQISFRVVTQGLLLLLPPLLVLLPLPLLLLLPLLLPLPLEYAVHCERFPGFPDLSVTLTLSCL